MCISLLCLLLSSAGLALFAGAPQQSSLATPSALKPALTPEQAMGEAIEKQRASLEKQRQAIQRQLGQKETAIAVSNPVVEFIEPLAPPNRTDCQPLGRDKVGELISAAARKESLDPALVRAVMKRESRFKPCAVSVKGAQGLMQLMPATAKDLHVADVFDPAQNVQAGAAYLKQLLERYKGDLRLALVGYNAGPSRADQRSKRYPLETQNYVAGIFAELGIVLPNETVQQDEVPALETNGPFELNFDQDFPPGRP